MTAKDTLEALARRCEEATAEHTSWLMKDAGAAIYDFGCDADERRRFYRLISQGAFLDAAMMLVPEGWAWAVDAVGRASCFQPNEPKPWPRVGGLAATPALALCAAALRARAAA